LLTDGDALQWGSLEMQVIHTPGHTPGSVSLYMPVEAGKITLAAPQLLQATPFLPDALAELIYGVGLWKQS